MTEYVVVHLYEGCFSGVYGPYSSRGYAVKKARKLCEHPVYDTDNMPEDTEYPMYPVESKDEVTVWGIGSPRFPAGVCHLTLANV